MSAPQSRRINIPANQLIAPASVSTWQPDPVAAELLAFLKTRLVEDRRIVDGVHSPVIQPRHQIGIGGGTTVLVPLHRFIAHLDAIEAVIVKYEAALSQVLRALEMGWPHGNAQVAAVAYLDALRVHALEYDTHFNYKEQWRP